MSSRCRYEDAEGENKSYAHKITELLRSLADIGDSKNAEAKVLEDELEAKNTEFVQWTMAQTLENTGFTKEQMKATLSSL